MKSSWEHWCVCNSQTVYAPVAQAASLLQKNWTLLPYSLHFRWSSLLFVTPTKPTNHMWRECVWTVCFGLLLSISHSVHTWASPTLKHLIRTPELCRTAEWLTLIEGCFRIRTNTLSSTTLTILPPACFKTQRTNVSHQAPTRGSIWDIEALYRWCW